MRITTARTLSNDPAEVEKIFKDGLELLRSNQLDRFRADHPVMSEHLKMERTKDNYFWILVDAYYSRLGTNNIIRSWTIIKTEKFFILIPRERGGGDRKASEKMDSSLKILKQEFFWKFVVKYIVVKYCLIHCPITMAISFSKILSKIFDESFYGKRWIFHKFLFAF